MTKEERVKVYRSPLVSESIASLADCVKQWAMERGFEEHVTKLQTAAVFHGDDQHVRETRLKDIEDLFTGQQIALTVSEMGELLEAVRKPKPDDHIPEHMGIHAEWADTLIRWLHLGHRLDIEKCVAALRAKLEYNESRPFKHGGKAF